MSSKNDRGLERYGDETSSLWPFYCWRKHLMLKHISRFCVDTVELLQTARHQWCKKNPHTWIRPIKDNYLVLVINNAVRDCDFFLKNVFLTEYDYTSLANITFQSNF